MKVSYQISKSSQVRGDTDAIVSVCMQLEKEGRLSPEELVNVSRDENAPLHDMFEWDDSIAAEEWRKQQARHIIASIEIKYEDKPITYRAFSSVAPKTYVLTQKALSKDDTREIILKNALRELETFKKKYNNLTELAELFGVIEQLEIQLAK